MNNWNRQKGEDEVEFFSFFFLKFGVYIIHTLKNNNNNNDLRDSALLLK